jgi:broad specificity phosphatase PhoE
MKPKRIILVRHGESEGNADRTRSEFLPDYKFDLTPKGIEQAREAGREIKRVIGAETVHAYVSPYYRTRRTYAYILGSIKDRVVKSFEDPRLREQDWGHLRSPHVNKKIDRERDKFGPFYYRIPDGESGADVYDRVSTFLETLHRDFEKTDYAQNTLIVTHGFTLRLFLMRWFHWSVEKFHKLANPSNGGIVVMQQGSNNRYASPSELARKR